MLTSEQYARLAWFKARGYEILSCKNTRNRRRRVRLKRRLTNGELYLYMYHDGRYITESYARHNQPSRVGKAWQS